MRQFSIITLEDSNFDFQCRSYERFHYRKNHQGYEHMHAYSEIFFVTEGCGYFHLRNRKVPIHRGMVIVNNSNVQHTDSSMPDEELEYAFIAVDNLSFHSTTLDKEESTFFLDFSKDYDVVFDFIRQIEREWIVREQFWQCALQTQLNSFILYILRNSNLLALPAQSSNDPNPLANVHLYLTANYADDISLDKLADLFCINKYYLAHTFKKIYGDSIMHTLNLIRCQTAKNLLENTTYSVSEISTTVGYNSSSYFSKIYKKTFGETPLQTRNSFWKKAKNDEN